MSPSTRRPLAEVPGCDFGGKIVAAVGLGVGGDGTIAIGTFVNVNDVASIGVDDGSPLTAEMEVSGAMVGAVVGAVVGV